MIENCDGMVIGTQAQAYQDLCGLSMNDGKVECPLFLFRFGKNPNLSRERSEGQKRAIANLIPFRKGENARDKVPV